MRRATVEDAPEIASIINSPTIRPYIGGGDQFLDPTDVLADEKNITLFDEGGGQFFHWKGPGIYEAHSFYLVRGADALSRGREAVRRMFEDYGAEKIWRAPASWNRRARWFNRQLGFKSLGEIDTAEGRCELFELRGSKCL